MNYWLVVGAVQNWDTAFEQGNIWGLTEKQRHLWEGLHEDDSLLFYATNPVGGIIGHGSVRTKFKQNKPLWPKELKEHKVTWPLRFEFDVEFCLPRDSWKNKKVTSKLLFPRSGFQILDQGLANKLIPAIGTDEYIIKDTEPSAISESIVEYAGDTDVQATTPSLHDQTKNTLIQIGKLQNFIAESEYSFELGKIDVVWRRVINSVPTYAFEIQVSGNIYQALSKLKHAYDLWNSHIYIVAPEADRDKVNSLLSGTFHEINSRINFIELGQVEELYRRKKSYKEFEKNLGI